MEGNAELTVQSGNGGGNSPGISAGKLTIQGGTVKVTGGKGSGMACGIMSYDGKLEIIGGMVYAYGGSSNMMSVGAYSGSTVGVAEGASLYADGGGAPISVGICSADTISGNVNGIALQLSGETTAAYIVCGEKILKTDLIADLTPLVGGGAGIAVIFNVPAGTSLTVSSGVTLDLSNLAVADITFAGAVINNGTILLPEGFSLDNAPKSGTVKIGEKSYTYDSENNKWICGEGSHTMDVTTGKCSICDTAMTVIVTVTDGTNTYYAADADTLNQAVTAILEQGSRTITVDLPSDASAEMFTAIRRALIDTEDVADGSIDLTLSGVTTIPDHHENAQIFGEVIVDKAERVLELKSISLPDVVTIGSYAFLECINMTSVNIPKVQTVGEEAFHGCSNMISIHGPKIQTVGKLAFTATGLVSVELPEATTLEDQAFLQCVALTDIKLPQATNLGIQALDTVSPDSELTVYLTTDDHITVEKDLFSILADYGELSTKVNLVLNSNKQSDVIGNTWTAKDADGNEVSFTFKSIVFVCTDGTTNHNYTYTPNDDGVTHKKACGQCGLLMAASEDHYFENDVNKCVCGKKIMPEVTSPVAKEDLIYDGTMQTLINAGSTTGGTMMYRVDDGEWSAQLPVGTDAGDYTVSYRVDGDTNYDDVAEQSFTVSIARVNLADAAVTLSETSYTYDGQAHYPAVTVTLDGFGKLVEGKDYRVFCSRVRTWMDGKPTKWFGNHVDSYDCINANDDYYAVVIGLGNFYTADDFTLYEHFVINPRELTNLTFEGLKAWYLHTGEAIVPEFILKDGETGLTRDTDYTAAIENNTDVGTATITVTLQGNYSGTVTKTFEIKTHEHEWNYEVSGMNTIVAKCIGAIDTCTDAEQSFTLNASDAVYSGEMVEAEVTREGLDLTYAMRYTGTNYDSADAPANAGDYTVTMNVGDKSISDTFTISPKDISKVASCQFSLAENSFVYSGTAPVLNVTGVDSSIGSYTMQEGTDYTVGTIQVNAGDHKLTVTGKGNYTGSVELDYAIAAKEVSITGAEIQDVTYDPDGYTLTVTGVTFDGVAEGETLAYIAEATLDSTNAVGEQEATVSVTLNNNNYTLATATYQTKVTINKAVAAVITSPVANTLTYTSEELELISAGTASGGEMQYSLDGENWSTDIPSAANADTYKVFYKVVGDVNHSDTDISVVDVTIKPKEVIPSVSGSYTKVYDGTNLMQEADRALSLTLEGVISGDDLSASANFVFDGADAGTTTVKVSNITLAGVDADNYKLSAEELSLDDVGSIVPLDINTGMVNVYLGEGLVYNGAMQTQVVEKVTVENDRGDTTVREVTTFKVTGNTGTDAGTYTMTIKGTGNYTGFITENWSIKQRQITEADVKLNGSLSYSGSEQTQAVTVTEGVTYEVTGNKATNVGTYELTVKGTGNYTGEVKLSWSIREVPATVTTEPIANTLNYTGKAQELITPGTTADGTLMYKLETDGTYSTSVPTGTDAADYTVYYYVKGDANHKDLAEQKIEVTIDKLDITDLAEITEGADLTYNGKEQTKSVSSVKMGELNVTYTVSGNTGTEAGDYTMTVTANGNYKGTVTKNWSIRKKQVMILANAQTITYGNSISDTEFTSDGLVEGHIATAVLTPSTSNVTADGTITVSDAVILANSAARASDAADVTANYDIRYGEPAKLVIEPDTSGIDSLTVENVTSANEADIKAVQTMMENAESIKEEWRTISETCKELIQKTEAVKAENTRITDAVSGFDLTSVKSSDEDTIAQLIADIEAQLSGNNLTDEERTALTQTRSDAEALLAAIEKAQNAADTENTEKVENITSENVKPTDKEALEDARADLEKALADHSDNYTESQKQVIQSEIDRISEALEVVLNVENVTGLIGELPNKLNAKDKALAEEIKAVKEAYDNLTVYEKSLLDEKVKEKLNKLTVALEKAEESEKETEAETEKTNATEKTEEAKGAAETGDNSPAEMWMLTMLGSLLALLLFGRKRYGSQNR